MSTGFSNGWRLARNPLLWRTLAQLSRARAEKEGSTLPPHLHTFNH